MTGVDLHESKGVAAAAADTVFVADGAGSGVHQKIPSTALAPLANPFGAQLLHVREEQSQNTATQTSTTGGVFVASAFNTVKTNEITGASLSSNQITLPAGTYFIDAVIPFSHNVVNGSSLFKAQFQNMTTSTSLIFSQASIVYSSGAATLRVAGHVVVRGRFTLAAPSVLELQQLKTTYSAAVSNLGPEIYAEALIWKLV